MNIEMLERELKTINAHLRDRKNRFYVNHINEKLFIFNENDKWIVFGQKSVSKGSNEICDLREHYSEAAACADLLQREKEYQDRKIKEYEDSFSDESIEITVVTDTNGLCGYSFVGGYWIYWFGIIAWCESDGVVRQGYAKLERKMTSEDSMDFRKHITDDDIYRVKVRKQKESVDDTICFYLDEVIERTTHSDLQRVLDKSFEPISLHDEYLGNIVWDRKSKSFALKLELWNGDLTVNIYDEEVESLKEYLPVLRKHITWIQNNREEFFTVIATDDMIESANEWREADNDGIPYYEINGEKIKEEITREVFVNALDKCKCGIGLTIYNDVFYFGMYFSTNQPDLFTRHCIEVGLEATDDNYEIELRGITG